MPFDMMYKDLILKGQTSDELLAYVKSNLEQIWNNPISEIEFPLGLRQIKINTVLSLDGELVTISGKTSGGRELLMSPFSSAVYDSTNSTKEIIFGNDSKKRYSNELYIKILENAYEKGNNDINYLNYAGINKELNKEIYNKISEVALLHAKIPGSQTVKFDAEATKMIFEQLDLWSQIRIILNMISIFKTGKKGTIDMSLLGASAKCCATQTASKLSNLSNRFSEVFILDVSPAGLHVKKSSNLLDFLKD